MKKLGSNKVKATIIASIAAASIAIVACLVMIFVNNTRFTSREIVNGLSAAFDVCESVSSIAEATGSALEDDGEEALELAEINAFDFNVAEASN